MTREPFDRVYARETAKHIEKPGEDVHPGFWIGIGVAIVVGIMMMMIAVEVKIHIDKVNAEIERSL